MCEGKVVHVWREGCACVEGRLCMCGGIECEGQIKV